MGDIMRNISVTFFRTYCRFESYYAAFVDNHLVYARVIE